MWRPAALASLLLAALLAACVAPPAAELAADTPEGASGLTTQPGWSHERQAVAAAHPLAAQAGLDALRAGGSAVDAAIAVQMVLTLVEPQSSGIGGGAFLLHHDGKAVVAYDGRETAPAAADEKLFLNAEGKPLPFIDAVVGGRSVGVPGTVAGIGGTLALSGPVSFLNDHVFQAKVVVLLRPRLPLHRRLTLLLHLVLHSRRAVVTMVLLLA